MAKPDTSSLTFRPDISREKKKVSGDIPIEIKTPDAKSAEFMDKTLGDYQQALDKALQIDEQFDEIRNQVNALGSDLSIEVDAADRPLLSEAIRRLSGGQMDAKIDYDTYDKALRIMDNAFVAQFGYDPAQLLFAKSDGQGHKVPRTAMPDYMDCDQVANLDLRSIQSDTEEQSLESIHEQRQKHTQVGLLAMLFKMLLAFLFRFNAKLLRRSKLHKVPIAGRVVKRIIRKLERAADRLMAWLEKGQAYEEPDSDLTDFMAQVNSLSERSSSECVQAASRVIKHAIHWAANTSSEESAATQSVLLRPILDRSQAIHETNKFNLKMALPDELKDAPQVKQLDTNTRTRLNYSNRYLNRSINQ